MNEEVSKCGREGELISFLYGELNDVEAQTFQRHRRECQACSAELAAFSDVRESVVAWRNESLGAVISPLPVTNPAGMAASSAKATTASASGALSALREFFNLSPLWLKGALAFASVLFCVFAGLAIARLRDQPPIVNAGPATPATPAKSQQEIDALVEQRVQAELLRLKNATEQQQNPALMADKLTKNPVKRAGRSEVAGNATYQKARRPLSKTEREQLAADLRLSSGKNDSELDLLDDRINQ